MPHVDNATTGRQNEQLERLRELRSPNTCWFGDKVFARSRPVALFRQPIRRACSGLPMKRGLTNRCRLGFLLCLEVTGSDDTEPVEIEVLAQGFDDLPRRESFDCLSVLGAVEHRAARLKG